MKIKLYRVVLNILFYVFYVILVSIAFSFIFPTILVIFWQDVIAPNNPIFDTIQIVIIILVLLFSVLFRKFFYLPIKEKIDNKTEQEFRELKKQEKEKGNENTKDKNKEISDELELDIKVGKEIK
jgi:hypothetical protein